MKIAVVCLGNICRSPMAEVVLRDRLDGAGLDDVELVSAGTGGWHAGEKMDRRAAATLAEAGYDPERHRAQQWPVGDSETYDLVLAMDADNLADLAASWPDGGLDKLDHRADLAGQAPGGGLRMFRDFDPEGPGDVPDPYYGGAEGFREVLAMVERTSDAIVATLATSRRGS
ncbi:low molecular weight protein-tyrosine-phosphatase [Nocardioides albus]|uniref:protein-tyrosine-phosphatase n=1 Tax=Nocardioides albus TaxID=1841 RepID=A0A7W5A6U9_9ACTN|nr:low molecular weight protein-tyrosine-phosphatase [Nocardioides albus]MBB3090555.1 protein-tyrosine phosphatase [Nocardioides albus]GGU24710.1 protein-tyrosine-phosphatase [Nocardioides albus]